MRRLLAWERADVAALLAEEAAVPASLRVGLAAFDAAIVYSRSAALARTLTTLIPRVVVHDPTPPDGGGHASVWLARPVTSLGVWDAGEPAPHSPTGEEAQASNAFTRRLPAGFLAIHPGSGSPRKNWPSERFAAVVEAVSAGRPWLLVEGPAEVTSAATLGELPGAVLARELPPRLLGAVLSCAGVYLGNDSGVSHLAAAWGTRTVALFGPTDPEVWAPCGACVRVVRAPGGGMEEIAVADVIAATSAVPGPPSS